jgi:argininosuccinate lyase
VAFRVAHGIVGRLVAEAEAAGGGLQDLGDEVIAAALRGADDPTTHDLAGDLGTPRALRGAATIEAALGGADVVGGTAPARVREALAAARARLGRR